MSDTIRFNTRTAQFAGTARSAAVSETEERLTSTGRIVHDSRGNAVFLLAGEGAGDTGTSGLLRRLDVPGLSLEGSEVRRLGASSSFRAENSVSGFNPYNHSASDTVRVQSLIDRSVRDAQPDDGTSTSRIRRLFKVR